VAPHLTRAVPRQQAGSEKEKHRSRQADRLDLYR